MSNLDTVLSVHDDYLTLHVRQLRKPKINFNISTPSIKAYGVTKMAIKAGNKVAISIDPRDSFGNVAKVDSTTWNLVGDDLGSLDVAGDGLSSVFTSNGKVGQVSVEVSADADLSESVRALSGAVSIDIEAGEAVDLGVHAEPIVVAVAPVVEEPAAPATETQVEVAPATETVAAEEAPVDAAPADTATVDTAAPVADTTATETPAV